MQIYGTTPPQFPIIRPPDPSWGNDQAVVFLWMQLFDQFPKEIRDWINNDQNSIPTHLPAAMNVWNVWKQYGVTTAIAMLNQHSREARIHYRLKMGLTPEGKTHSGYKVY